MLIRVLDQAGYCTGPGTVLGRVMDSQPGMGAGIRDDTDTGYSQHPVDTVFGNFGILDRGLCSVDVGSAIGGVHSGGYTVGRYPG